MPFDLILFDLDGTLVDSAPDITTALNTTLAEAGFPTVPGDRVLGYIGDGATKLVQRALPPGARADLGHLVRQFRTHYAAHVCEASRLYPGIAALLTALSPSTPLAILTNKPGGLARSLMSALAVDHHFRDIIGDGDGFPRKPAPEAAHALIAKHQSTPGRTLFVGDGLPDVQIARTLGCVMAAVTWGYVARDTLVAERPDHLIETVADLLAIITRAP